MSIITFGYGQDSSEIKLLYDISVNKEAVIHEVLTKSNHYEVVLETGKYSVNSTTNTEEILFESNEIEVKLQINNYKVEYRSE